MKIKVDLFDVFANEEVRLIAPQAGIQHQVNNEKVRDVTFNNTLIGLGFAMEIPEGFKANLYPRSSTYSKWGIIFGNHVGQIDSTYCGNNDEWKVNAIALRATEIHIGDKLEIRLLNLRLCLHLRLHAGRSLSCSSLLRL